VRGDKWPVTVIAMTDLTYQWINDHVVVVTSKLLLLLLLLMMMMMMMQRTRIIFH